MWPLLGIMALFAGEPRSVIKADEEVLFFPTYAVRRPGADRWSLPIHGWIFEREADSLRRAAALEILRRGLGLSSDDSRNAVFRARMQYFLADNERGKEVFVRLGGGVYSAGMSAENGHFQRTLQVPSGEIAGLRAVADARGWVSFHAVSRPQDPRSFRGRVQVLAGQGRSVISDIDDTIKISEVTDRSALLANTLLKPFRPVPGMGSRYRRWAEEGAALHYVSASPWQLYPALAEFLEAEGFPAGSFHLKTVRLKDTTALALFGSQQAYKIGVIEGILADFPERKFTLVGDSGEQDPEIYGAIARKHRAQVERILIRSLGSGNGARERYLRAFEDLPRGLWQLIDDSPEERSHD